MAIPLLRGLDDDEIGSLRYLGYDDGDAAAAARRARILRGAAKLRRLFLLPVPDAPGLVFFGGEVDPAIVSVELAGMPVGNLAGSGLAPRRAFEACVGEAIEYLSQLVCPGDRSSAARPPTASRHMIQPQGVSSPTCLPPAMSIWLSQSAGSRSVRLGTEAWFADLCLRRPATQTDLVPAEACSSAPPA